MMSWAPFSQDAMDVQGTLKIKEEIDVSMAPLNNCTTVLKEESTVKCENVQNDVIKEETKFIGAAIKEELNLKCENCLNDPNIVAGCYCDLKSESLDTEETSVEEDPLSLGLSN